MKLIIVFIFTQQLIFNLVSGRRLVEPIEIPVEDDMQIFDYERNAINLVKEYLKEYHYSLNAGERFKRDIPKEYNKKSIVSEPEKDINEKSTEELIADLQKTISDIRSSLNRTKNYFSEMDKSFEEIRNIRKKYKQNEESDNNVETFIVKDEKYRLKRETPAEVEETKKNYYINKIATQTQQLGDLVKKNIQGQLETIGTTNKKIYESIQENLKNLAKNLKNDLDKFNRETQNSIMVSIKNAEEELKRLDETNSENGKKFHKDLQNIFIDVETKMYQTKKATQDMAKEIVDSIKDAYNEITQVSDNQIENN